MSIVPSLKNKSSLEFNSEHRASRLSVYHLCPDIAHGQIGTFLMPLVLSGAHQYQVSISTSYVQLVGNKKL